MYGGGGKRSCGTPLLVNLFQRYESRWLFTIVIFFSVFVYKIKIKVKKVLNTNPTIVSRVIIII
jgi:hypothetical protein